jgi:hypothetical protein
MRLSEAIRLGAMLRPQGFGELWTGGPQALNGEIVETPVRSCALGAAYDAIGQGYTDPVRAVPAEWELLIVFTLVRCPVHQRAKSQVGAIIGHLNDCHRWTREQIADWVETLESADSRREESEVLAASDPHVSDPGTPATRV